MTIAHSASPLAPPDRRRMLPAWRHVEAMTDSVGIFEHADHCVPRRDEGYCTDDVSRLLIAIVREPFPDRHLSEIARTVNCGPAHRSRRPKIHRSSQPARPYPPTWHTDDP